MAENSMAESYEYSLQRIEKQNGTTSMGPGEEADVEEDARDPDPAGGPGLVTGTGQDPGGPEMTGTDPESLDLVTNLVTNLGTNLGPTEVNPTVGTDPSLRTETD